MSPEQVKGIKPLTVQSDLFSVGTVFYYMLVGVAPFMTETLPDLYRQIVDAPHRSLTEIKPGLDRTLVRLVDMLLEKDPTKRGDGPAAIAFQLKKFLMKKKVIAPADRIRDYVRELNAAGVRTTSNLDPAQVRQWMGSLDLGKRPAHAKGRWIAAVISVLILVLSSITGWVYFRPEPKRLNAVRPTVPSMESESKPSIAQPQIAPQLVLSPIGTQRPQPLSTVTESRNAHKNFLPETTNQVLGTSKSVTPEFSESNGTAQLTVLSVPPFAEVFLDGYSLGRTPLEGKTYPSGRYRLTLKSKYCSGVDTTVTIQPGPQSFKFVLMQNPEDEGSK